MDTEKIEMIVKGEKANMQIYGAEAPTAAPDKRSKVKKSQSSFAPKTPPLELRVCCLNQQLLYQIGRLTEYL